MALAYSLRFRRCRRSLRGSVLRRSRAIDGRFERSSKRFEGRTIRARRSRRRHQAGAKLPEHFLPDLGIGGRMIDVDPRERQAAGFQRVAVAGDAIPLSSACAAKESGDELDAGCACCADAGMRRRE